MPDYSYREWVKALHSLCATGNIHSTILVWKPTKDKWGPGVTRAFAQSSRPAVVCGRI